MGFIFYSISWVCFSDQLRSFTFKVIIERCLMVLLYLLIDVVFWWILGITFFPSYISFGRLFICCVRCGCFFPGLFLSIYSFHGVYSPMYSCEKSYLSYSFHCSIPLRIFWSKWLSWIAKFVFTLNYSYFSINIER